MSTTRKIAHNTGIQLIGKVISTILGLVGIGMMTRYLGQEQFGWYITVISFLQFIGILMDFGLIPVTAQMMSEPHFEKEKLFKNLLGYRFVTAIIFLAIAPFIALFFPYPVEVKIAIGFSTISFLAVAMNQIFIGYYQNKLQMHLQVAGEVAGRVVLVVGLWAFIALHYSYLMIMAVLVLASVAYMLVMWIAASRQTSTRLAYDKAIWLAITKKMWPIAISIMFNVIYLKGDVILLSVFRDQTDVGIYGAAYRVLDVLGQTAMMLMGVLMPLMAYAWSRNLKEEFAQRFQQSFDIMMMFGLPMTTGAALLATPIMRLVAGEQFVSSGPILVILMLGVFAVYIAAAFGHTAVAMDKQRKTIWVYATTAVITLVGYLIFIPSHGMYGAAWMTAFSEFYTALALFFVIRHYSKVMLSGKALMKILFACAVMALVILSLPGWHVVLVSAVGALVYGVTLLAIGGISKETIREIVSLKK